MLKNMNKENFDAYAENKSISTLKNIFKVSEPTIKKWKSLTGTVPDYVIEIINLKATNSSLKHVIDGLNFDMLGYKQTVNNYLHSKAKLESLLND